jgi:hypothetical protein
LIQQPPVGQVIDGRVRDLDVHRIESLSSCMYGQVPRRLHLRGIPKWSTVAMQPAARSRSLIDDRHGRIARAA